MIGLTFIDKSDKYRTNLVDSNAASDNTIELLYNSFNSPFILGVESNNSIVTLTVISNQTTPILIEGLTEGTTNRTTHILHIDATTTVAPVDVEFSSAYFSLPLTFAIDDKFVLVIPAGSTRTLYGTLVNNKIYYNIGTSNTDV